MEGVAGQFLQKRRLCLDTDVSIAIIKDASVLSRIAAAAYGRTPFISSVTVFELLLRKTNMEPVEKFIAKTEILNFDEPAAKMASQLDKSLKQKGTPVDWRDLFIAATAIVNNCELATLNRKDFEKIEGLKLLDF